ncbi:MAG TPA: PKD domain-containing protein [Anaeromyxobacter sp.]|nr:PKD domain-containing protein [Anaeromyxobacter sp.]
MRHVLGWLAVAIVVGGCSGGGGGPSAPSCASTGAACSGGTTCCSGDCQGGVCWWGSVGDPCNAAGDCGPPLSCVSYVCANPGCLADGAACSLDGRCCALNCRANGTCGANRAPYAVAGPDATTYKHTTVTLDGSGSNDPDGDRIYLTWSLQSKPAGSYAYLSSTAQRPTFTPDAAGTYVVSLSVTDGLLSAGDTVTVTVPNRPPVADAGTSREVMRNSRVMLDGDASSDPDGDSLYYSWALTKRPAGSAAALVYEGAPWFRSVRPDLLGDYEVTLTVNDGDLSAQTSIVLTAVNGAPTAAFESYAAFNAGTLVEARGGFSSDPNADPLTYAWQLTTPVGSSSALVSTTARDTSFTPDVPGTYTLALTVSDGALTGTTTKQLTVYPRVALLQHDVVDALYDEARSQIVMASSSPYDAICTYATIAQSGSCGWQLFTHGTMRAVTVSADALAYGYGRVGYVGWNQLGTSVRGECPVTWVDGSGATQPFEPASVAIGPPVTIGAGKSAYVTRFLHAVPTPTGGKGVVTVDMYACSVVSVTDAPPAGFDGAAALRPGTQTLYALDAAGGGSLWTWDTSPLPAPMAAPTTATPGAPPGDRFWFHADGSRLVTSNGSVFDAALAPDGSGGWTLPSVGVLGNPGIGDPVPALLHANPSSALQRIAAIPATGASPTPLDVEVRQYSSVDFTLAAAPIAFPPIVRYGTVSPTHGQFAFYKGDGTKLWVLVQTDGTGGYYRGVVTLAP